MSSSRPLGHNVLKLTGFYFEASNPFRSRAMASHIYDALLEDTSDGRSTDIKAAKKHTTNVIHALFRICLRDVDFFRDAWGGREFWDAMSVDCPVDLNSKEFEKLVDAFVDARRKYQGSSVTRLTRIVDQWMSQIAGRTWPPSQFNSLELGMLEDPKIVGYIRRLVPKSLPVANRLSSPIDLKSFLCTAGLHNITEHSSLAIYLAPIGFHGDECRSQWRTATESLAQVYGTADEFVEYARDCFANRRKELVVGVFNHWFGTSHQVMVAYNENNGGRARDEFRVQKCPRTSVVIALQKINDRRIDIKLFDPSVALRRRQARPPPLTMQGHKWKTDFAERVRKTFLWWRLFARRGYLYGMR
ncbi:hypothetical protein Hte_005280 [Hypoxylon texense]